MAHRNLIGGTSYDTKGGRCLVDGTGYAIKKGRTLIDGTGYDVNFITGVRVGDLPVGTKVFMDINGTAWEFIVVHQGVPSDIYDSSCNGTWLLMTRIYTYGTQRWHTAGVNNYSASAMNTYLNGTFLSLFSSDIQSLIKTVKIPYANGMTAYTGANGLTTKIFLLSCWEIGWSNATTMAADGACLDYFVGATNATRVANRVEELSGVWQAGEWYTRTPSSSKGRIWYVTSAGGGTTIAANSAAYGTRPALVMNSDALVSDDMKVLG